MEVRIRTGWAYLGNSKVSRDVGVAAKNGMPCYTIPCQNYHTRKFTQAICSSRTPGMIQHCTSRFDFIVLLTFLRSYRIWRWVIHQVAQGIFCHDSCHLKLHCCTFAGCIINLDLPFLAHFQRSSIEVKGRIRFTLSVPETLRSNMQPEIKSGFMNRRCAATLKKIFDDLGAEKWCIEQMFFPLLRTSTPSFF